MATYTNHSQHAHLDPVEGDTVGETRERTSPVLMAGLAVALVAAGVWWYAQRDDGGIGTTATPVVTTIEPPAATSTPDARPVVGSRAIAEHARPVIADRAPLPLAGNPLPEYPRSALRAGEEGAVVVRIAVDAQGVPGDVQVVERTGTRDRSFDRAAIEAARQWRFQPAMRDGKAVPATVQLPVDFRRG
ncbi:energy transducer TonB [Pseudoxanthomonas daejeonensis]|uniref:TonB-dependent receptor n=1 Tax=Pseudoxanthomonas daejeonensis TaxID=266062 RepID=A0ABQ6ZAA4_9GAMM|nr:energy transducer TonB [Pseudoxanthomonas daejeonensis]KAF1696442.1 TonB-dependent receptor [Pseudoxanthomonas daejeonensis]